MHCLVCWSWLRPAEEPEHCLRAELWPRSDLPDHWTQTQSADLDLESWGHHCWLLQPRILRYHCHYCCPVELQQWRLSPDPVHYQPEWSLRAGEQSDQSEKSIICVNQSEESIYLTIGVHSSSQTGSEAEVTVSSEQAAAGSHSSHCSQSSCSQGVLQSLVLIGHWSLK